MGTCTARPPSSAARRPSSPASTSVFWSGTARCTAGARSTGIFPYDRYRGGRVLEVGCGMGTMASIWAREGAHVTAVDLNVTAVEQTRRRFELLRPGRRHPAVRRARAPIRDRNVRLRLVLGRAAPLAGPGGLTARAVAGRAPRRRLRRDALPPPLAAARLHDPVRRGLPAHGADLPQRARAGKPLRRCGPRGGQSAHVAGDQAPSCERCWRLRAPT